MANFARGIIFTVAFAFLITCSLHGEEKWERFNENKAFSYDYPKGKKPEHLQQKIPIPHTDLNIEYDTYISESSDKGDKVVYVVSKCHYPDEIDMTKVDAGLQDVFIAMLSALPDAEVRDLSERESNGVKELDFVVDQGEVHFQGRLMLKGNDLYQIFVVYKDVDMEKDYKHFIDSFKTNDKPKQNKMLKLSI